MLAGLLGGEELGAGRALRVEEPSPTTHASALSVSSWGLAMTHPKLGCGEVSPRTVGRVGGAAKEDGVVGVGGGARGGRRGGGGGGGGSGSGSGGEEEEGQVAAAAARPARRRMRRRHVVSRRRGEGSPEFGVGRPRLGFG